MDAKLKRVLTGVVVAVIATLLAPFMAAAPAFAAGSLQGPATIKNSGGAANLQSGDGATTFTLRLPAGASCPGDSANSNYHWDTYMVPSSTDPSTLQFASTGPTPSGVGASFSQPLYDLNGNPVVNQQTANQTTANGPGAIINIPDMNFQVFTPGQIPAGVYNLGIACILGPASATQESSFWNVQMTVATGTAANGNAQITWQNGTVPNAPVITSVSNGAPNGPGGTLVVNFTSQATPNPPYNNPAFTVTASNGGAPVTVTGNSSPITITGLTNGTSSNVTMVAANSVGNSATSNSVAGTPLNPQVTGLAATPSPNTVTLTWGQPSGATPAAPTSYTVSWTPTSTGPPTTPQTFACATASCNDPIGNLTPGTPYTFTVTYGAAGTANSASTGATPLSNAILLQDVSVTRPSGALVLTQVCGQYGNVPAEAASTGFPGGFAANAPAGNATGNTPSGPTTDNGSGQSTGTTDPNYPSQYPNPANPTYPTHCSLNLGTASLVTSGAGAGQYFAASGRLNQVTVVDSRDTDPGWTLSATMGTFSAGAGKTFSGNQLGWTNKSAATASFTDGSGNVYTQTVNDQPAVAPNTQGGAGTSHAMEVAPAQACTANASPAGSQSCTGGLGIATVDARIKVLIPIFARNGTYAGTLTITAA